jgi:hypothetical protein
MSWQAIDEMLGLALIDPVFCEALLREPIRAAEDQGFKLTAEEKRFFQGIRAHDLSEFSQRLIAAKNAALHQDRGF